MDLENLNIGHSFESAGNDPSKSLEKVEIEGGVAPHAELPAESLPVANKVAKVVGHSSETTSAVKPQRVLHQKLMSELREAFQNQKNQSQILSREHRMFALHTATNDTKVGNVFSESLKIYAGSLRQMQGGARIKIAEKLEEAANKKEVICELKKKLELEWGQAAINGTFDQEAINDLAEELSSGPIEDWTNEIFRLKSGEDLILPGIHSDHAGVYRIKRNANGLFELTVFNSGMGIKWHDSLVLNGKRKYFTSLTKDNISEDQIKPLVGEIFYAQFMPNLEGFDNSSRVNLREREAAYVIDGIYGYIDRYLEGDPIATSTDTTLARTPQRGSSCSKEGLDAYYFDEEIQLARREDQPLSEGVARYKATQSRLKVDQVKQLINDVSSRLKWNDPEGGYPKVTDEELRAIAFAVTKVENYWAKHGLKVLGYDESAVDVKQFLTFNRQVKSLAKRLIKKIAPYL